MKSFRTAVLQNTPNCYFCCFSIHLAFISKCPLRNLHKIGKLVDKMFVSVWRITKFLKNINFDNLADECQLIFEPVAKRELPIESSCWFFNMNYDIDSEALYSVIRQWSLVINRSFVKTHEISKSKINQILKFKRKICIKSFNLFLVPGNIFLSSTFFN